MPILRGAATFSRYRVEHDGKSSKKDLSRALKLRAFQPLERGGEEERAEGFVELADTSATGFTAGALHEGEFAVFAYRIDEIRIPSAVVRAELQSWEARFAEENQRPPSRKEKSERKEELKHTLRSRYPISTKTFDVSWNHDTDHLQIWAGSRKAIDLVQAAVEQALSIKLVPVAPVTVAQELGLSDKALQPTPALSLEEGADAAA